MGDDDDLVRAERDVQARVGDLPIDFTARAVVSNVFRVANVVRNHMETKVLGADDLSWTAFTALFVLWVGGDQESRHLAEECGVSKGTLTGVINTLERRELVTRSGHPDDGRLVVISLTATGRQMIRRLFPASTRTRRSWCRVSRKMTEPSWRTSGARCCALRGRGVAVRRRERRRRAWSRPA